ncbi:MAG: 4Fe-4S ferredoxin [Clostridiales bacterium]|nr:MAG: 4Fe-4S ferredoxin [Clostridiales bacterium]
MKSIYVNEKWCLGCHLCEYYCAFAQDGGLSITSARYGVKVSPRIRVEEHDHISYALSCRHCDEPLCVKSCITGALSKKDGVVSIDRDRCISCYTCILSCPFGAVSRSQDGAVNKCELCISTASGEPACVRGCPNNAIVLKERAGSC